MSRERNDASTCGISFRQVTAILCDMPRPRNERQALEEERDVELPTQLAKFRRNLEATSSEDKTRREFVEWQIRFAEKRMADVLARLARMEGEQADE
jgi:hypothetical protein